MQNGQKTDSPNNVISFGPNTEENRALLTKDLTAAIRWYATSEGRYNGDEQSLYRLSQYLERVHGIRDAS